jgi:6-phosphogluconate dehydrogenase
MELVMVGLGKMGANMTRRLLQGGHRIIGSDLDVTAVQELAAETGMATSTGLDDAIAQLEVRPRVVWVMVPAGNATESVVQHAAEVLTEGDVIVDGGNSNYQDTLRRATLLARQGLHYVDVGTSGGVWGLELGYSLMIGGDKVAVDHLRPVFETLAPAADKGWGHVGPNGAGHFVKMIHNGIEYGMMQAYAEGFDIMQAKEIFHLDLHQIANIWRYGSVVRSWLLDLTALALADDVTLGQIRGWVDDSGEGRWTVLEAIALNVPAPVITLSLQARFASRTQNSYAARLLAAMRNQFGGHALRLLEE